ncbi:hypothetical protein MRX96_053104 [Rhipicephalus microplus]
MDCGQRLDDHMPCVKDDYEAGESWVGGDQVVEDNGVEEKQEGDDFAQNWQRTAEEAAKETCVEAAQDEGGSGEAANSK